MSIKDFKNEYRLICTDTWGDAMQAWFECAGQMNKRGLSTPVLWQYKPGIGGGTEEDCYWYGIFENAPNNALETIGNYLFRYCQFLKYKKVDY
jgi:hypothetical protein